MDKRLARGQFVLLALSAFYFLFLGLLTIPYFQNHALYLHALRWPLFADLSNPVKYGLSASRSLNVQIPTRDNLQLGAWIVLPTSSDFGSTHHDGAPTITDISTSLQSRPTVLLFHGNAATRAVHFRVQHCSTYASRFGANVIAIDYRGYGDSQGTPSEEGLISDARAAWDWAVGHGAKAEDVLLVGMSLGTGVVSGLSAELASAGIRPKGIVLLAPFTSIKHLLNTYHLFGIVPILQPLGMFPPLQNLISRFLISQFNTTQALPSIKAPILLAHSRDDFEIPHTHSQILFDSLLEQYLPPIPALPSSHSEIQQFDWAAHKASNEDRRVRKAALVSQKEIPGFGVVQRLSRPNGSGEVMFVEALYGGHDRIGLQESLVDFMSSTFF